MARTGLALISRVTVAAAAGAWTGLASGTAFREAKEVTNATAAEDAARTPQRKTGGKEAQVGPATDPRIDDGGRGQMCPHRNIGPDEGRGPGGSACEHRKRDPVESLLPSILEIGYLET
jgi:hypothetical protein